MYNADFLVLLGKERQQALPLESEVGGLLELLRPREQTATPKPQTKPVQEETPCPA